jgi:hypothetical protein
VTQYFFKKQSTIEMGTIITPYISSGSMIDLVDKVLQLYYLQYRIKTTASGRHCMLLVPIMPL